MLRRRAKTAPRRALRQVSIAPVRPWDHPGRGAFSQDFFDATHFEVEPVPFVIFIVVSKDEKIGPSCSFEE